MQPWQRQCSLCMEDFLCAYREKRREEEKVTIGISMASELASYQKGLAGKMQEIAEQSDSYEVEFYYADWDADKQEEQLRDMIDKQVDSIILCPVDAKSFLNVLREAKDAGIPVVNLNMKLDPFSCEYITTYVGGSMSEEAVLAAELAELLWRGRRENRDYRRFSRKRPADLQNADLP